MSRRTTPGFLLENYGVAVNEGIVIEEDQGHFYYGYPYILIPEINSHAITDPIIENNYSVLMSIANGLVVSDENGTGTVTELLTTTSSAFSKADGYNLSTYEKEDGDTDGPFALAVSIEEASGGALVWFASNGEQEVRITLNLTDKNFPQTEIVFYRYDGTNCLATIDGESFALVLRSSVVDFIEAVNAIVLN